ncbi:MAG: ABC transporter permease, partial [Acidobacteriia bacterium]|nr:ABC transporter permease [Terriglobia bacterium]
MWKTLAYSLRTLRRSPLFTIAAALSLALGIGANTAVFSLIDQALLKLLPVRNPESLVVLHTDYAAPGRSSSDTSETVFSYPMYRQLRDRDPAFAAVVARSGSRVTLAWRGAAEFADVEVVSGNYFQALGVGAVIGRTLTPSDDGAPGAHPVAVLADAYWAQRFGRSPGVLNQTVTMNGHPLTVVGVAEPRFKGLYSGSAPDIYVPVAMKREADPGAWSIEEPQYRWLNIFARLKAGFPLAKAQAATDVVYRSVLADELAHIGKMRSARARDEFLNHRAQLRPAAQGINELRQRWRDPLLVLMGMSGLVLLIG